MSVMDYYPSKKETMQNIQLTIDGETKNLELIDMETPNRSAAKHLINNKWYREVEEKDYEVLSFKRVDMPCIYELVNGFYYNKYEAQLTFAEMMETVKTGYSEIFSVKRLSDGEVFTVKKDKEKFAGFIKSFEIVNGNKLKVNYESDFFNFQYLEELKRCNFIADKPTVLLTTHDGVKVTNPNQQLYICHKNFNRGECFANFISSNPHNVYFAYEESRENYIIQNKPVAISYAELTNRIIFKPAQIDLLVAFFKQKIF